MGSINVIVPVSCQVRSLLSTSMASLLVIGCLSEPWVKALVNRSGQGLLCWSMVGHNQGHGRGRGHKSKFPEEIVSKVQIILLGPMSQAVTPPVVGQAKVKYRSSCLGKSQVVITG